MNDAELSWTLADYRLHGVEPPSRIESDSTACEGWLMTDDEIEQYVFDGIRTLKILRDKKSDRFEPVRRAFWADLEFLVSIDRLGVDEYDDLTKPETYEF